MAMRQFGKVKFMPRPKTEEQWAALYNKHKILLPNIRKLELHWSSKGSGQTGARFFKAYQVPPIKYWNKELSVTLHKNAEEPAPASVKAEMADGVTLEENITGWKDDKILAWLRQINQTKAEADLSK
mmetsp:Transcript_8333/g.34926  ORF Transcript_8333/g.34926 Transcript_8333/m.34926 type:complete len:127 (-) Transcript_8333:24-404(-)